MPTDACQFFYECATHARRLFRHLSRADGSAYAGYAAVVGVLVEPVRVDRSVALPWTVLGGVPLWLLTLWVGFGLLTRRLVLPLVQQPKERRELSS